MAIPLHKPFVKRRDMDAVLTCLVSDLIAPGEQTASLVTDCQTLFGAASGLALREYARAASCALSTLQLEAGSKIAISVLAPSVWKEIIARAGLTPLWIDTNDRNPTISAEALRVAKDEQGFSAIVAIDSLGYLVDATAIRAFSVPVIEDMGYAFGQESAGLAGDVLLFPMEADGIVTCGGGAVVLAKNNPWITQLATIAETLDPGSRLPDMNAALGRTQLSESESFLERRREVGDLFGRAVLRSHHKLPLRVFGDSDPAWSCVVLAESGTADIISYARKRQVETKLAFEASVLSSWEEQDPKQYPNACALSLRTLLFPLYPGLRKKEIESIDRVLATLP